MAKYEFVAYTSERVAGILAVCGYRVVATLGGRVTAVAVAAPEWTRSQLLSEAVSLRTDPVAGSRLSPSELSAVRTWRSSSDQERRV